MKNSISIHFTKIIPLCFGCALWLTGCESINSFMSGNSSDTGYDSPTAAGSHGNQSVQSAAEKAAKKSTVSEESSLSGAAANTVSVPANSLPGIEKKGAEGVVVPPAVPSAAPMVGQ